MKRITLYSLFLSFAKTDLIIFLPIGRLIYIFFLLYLCVCALLLLLLSFGSRFHHTSLGVAYHFHQFEYICLGRKCDLFHIALVTSFKLSLFGLETDFSLLYTPIQKLMNLSQIRYLIT